jgi:hypothetical protein
MRTGTNELSEALARLQRDQSMHAVIRDLLGETEHFRLIGQAALLQFFLEILEKALKIRVRAPVSSKWSRPRPPRAGVRKLSMQVAEANPANSATGRKYSRSPVEAAGEPFPCFVEPHCG